MTAVTDLAARRKAVQRTTYAALVMGAWDRLSLTEKEPRRAGKASRLDTNPDVRRKAKSQL